jgi:hypothetical protein
LGPFYAQTAGRAVEAARRQLGDGYAYQVTSFNVNGKAWRAHVVAWRGDEVKQLDVGDPPP